jgi:hypothetical protein
MHRRDASRSTVTADQELASEVAGGFDCSMRLRGVHDVAVIGDETPDAFDFTALLRTTG